jgi:import inner membrane translocase subunit TIM44
MSLLRSNILPEALSLQSSSRTSLRTFHVSSRSLAEDRVDDKVKPQQESKATEAESEEAAEGESKKAEEGEEASKDKTEEEGKEKKEDLPPPPPHGDKTPWQVFMETMQSEFQQSKEWNESTKALASSAHQFTESESVRKARQAYEATSGAVSSTAANVVKTTAGAIGKGAAWTWETPVMKGVRKGANITGEALDKATKPIRETEAFKNVKNVIDDGSSSRYGGWVEKEERKKRRELRDQVDKTNGGKGNEVFVEDPE